MKTVERRQNFTKPLITVSWPHTAPGIHNHKLLDGNNIGTPFAYGCFVFFKLYLLTMFA